MNLMSVRQIKENKQTFLILLFTHGSLNWCCNLSSFGLTCKFKTNEQTNTNKSKEYTTACMCVDKHVGLNIYD